MSDPRNIGHRARLRGKLLSDPDSLADYEVLELLLSIAVPRRDVKPLAKDLLSRFKSFSGVVHADFPVLSEVKGVGPAAAAAVKIVEASCVRALRSEASRRPVIADWPALVDYCRMSIGCRAAEEFHVLYLDAKCNLIRDEVHSSGTVNFSGVYPREVLKGVLAAGASSVILVHNHPSGDTSPSRADIEMTKRIVQALAGVDVAVHDHLVVSQDGVSSFAALGLL
ncbi:MAG: DNA repair protein RadC [Rickettsiales bacterium]|jgi:DNA repair protein RadC|nr:DNA repair protein RadC [Rickettsiales bacterium]